MPKQTGDNNANYPAARNDETLQPAFTSSTQALCFLLIVALALALPEIITRSGLITRRHSYEIMPENQGAHSFVMDEVFDNKEVIDILFLGSSFLFAGIDTPEVQKELSVALGRPARVVTFGHYFNSIDILYMQIRDLLEQKRVRLVVLAIPRIPPYIDGPSTSAFRFLRYSEDKGIFNEVPLKYKAALYAGGVFRAPRDLLTIVRRNRIPHSPFAENLGADKAELGMGRDPRTFERFTPPSPFIRSTDLIYSRYNQDQFHFTNEEIPFFQNLYFEKLIETLRRNQVPLMMVNIPHYGERHSTRVIERKDWARRFGMNIPLVGVPPTVLFAGLDEKEIEKLYFDNEHLNVNGNEFFTRAILPAILEVYKTHAAKDY